MESNRKVFNNPRVNGESEEFIRRKGTEKFIPYILLIAPLSVLLIITGIVYDTKG
jgi:hypothetical protein